MTGDEIRAAIAALLTLRSSWIEAIALDLRLTHTESRIAIAAVSKYLNRDPTRARFGMFWPSVGSLMTDLNAGERTIQRVLQQAIKFGYLQLVEPGGGKHNTAVYRPTLPAGKTPPLAAPYQVQTPPPAAPNPATSGAKPRHQRHPTLVEDSDQGESASHSLRGRTRDPGDFETFWQSYPNKVGKRAAEAKYQRALARASPAELLAGVERYKATKPPDRQWCNPTTWLSQDRWLDEPAPMQQEFLMALNGGNRNGQDRRAARDADLTRERRANLATTADELVGRVAD